MKRMFGKKKKKRQLTPKGTEPKPAFHHAMQIYSQTVAPESCNDDGLSVHSMSSPAPAASLSAAAAESTARDGALTRTRDVETGESLPISARPASTKGGGTTPTHSNRATGEPPLNIPSTAAPPAHPIMTEPPLQQGSYDFHGMKPNPLIRETEMPDATYEEHYGDAYVGGTIKYIYPSGYQSMRPRGGPWKVSIAVCVLFTWLSIFIVGHCSDRVADQYEQYQGKEFDDDELVIEIRWCGSRPLYFMWVVSMLVTGLAAAYCSIIGYIKVRDFAVANMRSQPPGMLGKSDYYVRIADYPPGASPPGSVASIGSTSQYQKTIYQSDGTPAFWGGHIYRPTQAAVAVTSR